MIRKYILPAFVLLALAGYSQYSIDSNSDYFKKRDTFLALPTGNTVKIMSFGNSELVADLLYIWSIQFYSDYTILNSKDFIEDIFNLITDISPRYRDPYLMGSTIMAIELKEIEMAVRLLQKGARNIKDEWVFDFESGYYTSKYINDYTLAETYYKKAASKKGAPKFLSRMMYHSIYMQGKLEESWDLWMSVLKNAETVVERYSAHHHLYQIKFELDRKKLKPAIDSFYRRNGFFPHKLDDLVHDRYLKEIPKDFKGYHYQYDNKKGTIIPKEGYLWKKQL